MQTPELIMKAAVWKRLITTLKKQGGRKLESGAFLLGKPLSGEITEFITYLDLDPGCLDTGIICFNGNGYIPLWNHCMEDGLKVLADVHTHPGKWTGQSGADRAHPMIAQKGHIALIVPIFANGRKQLLNGVGIHEFLGDRNWRSWPEDAAIVKLT